MKNTFILTVMMTFLFVGQAMSQGLHIGAKAGVNFANFSGGELDGFDFTGITNFHGGVFLELATSQRFSIQPEVIYSSQGANISDVTSEYQNRLGYLSVPLMARIYFVPDRFSLDLGPTFSFLMNEVENPNFSPSNDFDFALSGGLTGHLSHNFFLQARYNLGLTDVRPDANVRNSVIQFSFGIRF